MKGFVSLVVWMMIFPSLSFAARPLSTNDAGTVEKGAFEIEYGIEYTDGFDNEVTMSLAVTRGFFDNLDLGIEIPYTFIDAKQASNSDGFSDLSLCTKIILLKDKEVFPDLSLAFAYKSDSGNDLKGLGTGKSEYSLNGIFSKSFELFVLHSNLGYSFKEDFDDQENEDALTYGLAFECPINNRLTLVGEVSGETVFKRKFHDSSCSTLFGLNYTITDSIVLDIGVSAGISRSDPDFSITSGITIEL